MRGRGINHYKSVMGAGSKAKTVTSLLPQPSVLCLGVCSGLLKGTESLSSLNEWQNFKYDGRHLDMLLSPDTSRIPPLVLKSEVSQEDEANFVMMSWSTGKDVTGIFVKPPCGAALSRRWYWTDRVKDQAIRGIVRVQSDYGMDSGDEWKWTIVEVS